jgi:predicted nucleic acid-binding protein
LTLILDSGGLLAALDPNQNLHREFREALEEAREPRIISPFVVAELDYMISRDYGRDGQIAFHEEVDRGAYRLETFAAEDFSRARSLIEAYTYLPGFGIADASCVVLAERYEAFDILTTDQRDFREVAGSRGRRFRILPYDS